MTFKSKIGEVSDFVAAILSWQMLKYLFFIYLFKVMGYENKVNVR